MSAGDGSWLAAWGFHRPGSSRAGLQARAIPAAGRLEPVEQVAPLGVFGGQDYPFSGDGGLAASADEHAIAVWDRHLDSSQSVIEASLGPLGRSASCESAHGGSFSLAGTECSALDERRHIKRPHALTTSGAYGRCAADKDSELRAGHVLGWAV